MEPALSVPYLRRLQEATSPAGHQATAGGDTGFLQAFTVGSFRVKTSIPSAPPVASLLLLLHKPCTHGPLLACSCDETSTSPTAFKTALELFPLGWRDDSPVGKSSLWARIRPLQLSSGPWYSPTASVGPCRSWMPAQRGGGQEKDWACRLPV